MAVVVAVPVAVMMAVVVAVMSRRTGDRVDRQVARPHCLLVVDLLDPMPSEDSVDGDVEARHALDGMTPPRPVDAPAGLAEVVASRVPGVDVPVLGAPHPHLHLAAMVRAAPVDPGLDQDAVRRGVLELQVAARPADDRLAAHGIA